MEFQKKNDSDLFYSEKNKIINFLQEKAGLESNKNKDTVLITDYVIDDGKISVRTQLGEEVRGFLKEYKYDLLVILYYVLALGYTGYKFFKFISAVKYMDASIQNFNMGIAAFIMIFTLIVWTLSTSTKILSLTGHKIKLLNLSIVIIACWFLYINFDFFYHLFIPWIASLEIDEFLTENKVVVLAWLVIILPTVLITWGVTYLFYRLISSPNTREDIRLFKIKHHIRFRKNSKYDYDLKIVKDDKTGKTVVVYEHRCLSIELSHKI
jgi:hypothetical protein